MITTNVTVGGTQYTQLNTIADAYTVVNVSEHTVEVVLGDSQPDASLKGIPLKRGEAISGADFNGTAWGKVSLGGDATATVVVTE